MDRIKLFIGTGFGVGFIPFAPGTFGSLTALFPIYLILNYNARLYLFLMIAASCALSFWVSSYFEEKYEKDPALLVTDEWAGQALTFAGISFTGTYSTNFLILIAGFLLFRLFDIWKPLGIKKIQQLPNGLGVLADDLLAGFYALICLKSSIFVVSYLL